MVPSLERSEYMNELRNIADHIVRERCKHSDVHFATHSEGAQSYKLVVDSEDVDPPLDAGAANVSPSIQGDSHVGPVFHIPMTQEKSLEDLPSHMDFDWQDCGTPGPSTAPTTTRNLGEELDVVSTPAKI